MSGPPPLIRKASTCILCMVLHSFAVFAVLLSLVLARCVSRFVIQLSLPALCVLICIRKRNIFRQGFYSRLSVFPTSSLCLKITFVHFLQTHAKCLKKFSPSAKLRAPDPSHLDPSDSIACSCRCQWWRTPISLPHQRPQLLRPPSHSRNLPPKPPSPLPVSGVETRHSLQIVAVPAGPERLDLNLCSVYAFILCPLCICICCFISRWPLFALWRRERETRREIHHVDNSLVFPPLP